MTHRGSYAIKLGRGRKETKQTARYKGLIEAMFRRSESTECTSAVIPYRQLQSLFLKYLLVYQRVDGCSDAK